MVKYSILPPGARGLTVTVDPTKRPGATVAVMA
jgi:hypothetical protein